MLDVIVQQRRHSEVDQRTCVPVVIDPVNAIARAWGSVVEPAAS